MLYIITVAVRNEMVRVQMDNLKSAIGFAGWCAIIKGHLVRGRYGKPLLHLSQREQSLGNRLVNEYTKSKSSVR